MARVVLIGAPELDAHSFAQRLRADFPDIDLFATHQRELAAAHLQHCEVLIGHHFQFDNQILERSPNLRLIQSLTSGTDAILALSSLCPDVIVTSTRGMHGPQMSELVFLAMLSLSRDYARMLRNQQAAIWERWPQPLLVGKTAVLVGVGAISACMALRCKSFGMTVYGVTSSPRAVDGFDHIFDRGELRHAAALADFLILVVPHSPETDNLIDHHVLSAMKPTAFLINVARGGVLDEQALVAALNEERLAGAALDVFRQIPLPAESPLWHQKRLLITPLIGGMSDIYLEQCYPLVSDNLRHFFNRETDRLINKVTRPIAPTRVAR